MFKKNSQKEVLEKERDEELKKGGARAFHTN